MIAHQDKTFTEINLSYEDELELSRSMEYIFTILFNDYVKTLFDSKLEMNEKLNIYNDKLKGYINMLDDIQYDRTRTTHMEIQRFFGCHSCYHLYIEDSDYYY